MEYWRYLKIEPKKQNSHIEIREKDKVNKDATNKKEDGSIKWTHILKSRAIMCQMLKTGTCKDVEKQYFTNSFFSDGPSNFIFSLCFRVATWCE